MRDDLASWHDWAKAWKARPIKLESTPERVKIVREAVAQKYKEAILLRRDFEKARARGDVFKAVVSLREAKALEQCAMGLQMALTCLLESELTSEGLLRLEESELPHHYQHRMSARRRI